MKRWMTAPATADKFDGRWQVSTLNGRSMDQVGGGDDCRVGEDTYRQVADAVGDEPIPDASPGVSPGSLGPRDDGRAALINRLRVDETNRIAGWVVQIEGQLTPRAPRDTSHR